MEQLPPLNALRALEAAARTGGFARAAKELFVTQSAVSHQIRQLEQWFGFRLFERTGGRARPTPRGEALARVLTDAFSDITVVCGRMRETDAGTLLKIATIPSVAVCWLIPRIQDFYGRHSDIPVRLSYAIYGQAADLHETDVAIVYSRGHPRIAGAHATPIFEGAAVPMCSAAFRDRHAPLNSAWQIAAVPLLHDTDTNGWQQWFSKVSVPRPAMSEGPMFEDFHLMHSATLAGQGVALCPPSILGDDLSSGRLIALSDEPVNADFRYYFLEPIEPRRGAARHIEAFKSWLLEKIDEDNARSMSAA